MIKKIYISGSLFNEAEIKQRKFEGDEIRKNFPSIKLYNPAEQSFNTNKENMTSPISLFNKCTKQIVESDVFIADITNFDPGVMMELGIAIAIKTKHIICVNSDIRLPNAYHYDIPSYSINHYALGAILKYGKLVSSFADAIKEIENIIKQ